MLVSFPTLIACITSEHALKIRELVREHKKVVYSIAQKAKQKSTEEIDMQVQACENDHGVWLEFEINRMKQAYEAEFHSLHIRHTEETNGYRATIESLKRSKKTILEDIKEVKDMYLEGYKMQTEDNSALKQEYKNLLTKVEDLTKQINVLKNEKEEWMFNSF